MLLILQLTILLSGFTAAALWWWASTLKSKTVPTMDGIILREGDLAFRYCISLKFQTFEGLRELLYA